MAMVINGKEWNRKEETTIDNYNKTKLKGELNWETEQLLRQQRGTAKQR